MKRLFHGVYDVTESDGHYRPSRFTKKQIKALASLRKVFGEFGQCASGVSLAFYTDKEELSFEYAISIVYTEIGSFDVYENGVMEYSYRLPTADAVGKFSYKKKAKGETLVEIFMPNNAKVELWGFDFGNYRIVEEKKRKLLFYGDSITQCAYIPSSSLSFATVASHMTNSEFLNRGVGSLYFDESTIDEDDMYEPDIIFIEFGANDIVKKLHDEVVFENGKVLYCNESDLPQLEEKARKYLEKVKRVYKNSKIYVISMMWNDVVGADYSKVFYEKYRELIRLNAEILDMGYIDGRTLFPHIRECLVEDGIHLSQLGSVITASFLIEYIN